MQREQAHLLLDTVLDMGQALIRRHSLPAAAKAHFRAAQREALLGVRVLVDTAIERLDQNPAPPREPAGPRTIPVD